MSAPDRYETLARPVLVENEISRSRFLAYLERADDEEQARAMIARVRAEHPRARHWCTAFVLGADRRIRRSNDDGEPSGTAGAPMLESLDGSGLSDVVAVVVRYFGGVLLGTGGLVRAYGGAVRAAIDVAPRCVRERRVELTVAADYEQGPALEAEARRIGWVVAGVDYGTAMHIRLAVPPGEEPAVTARVAEITAGRAVVSAGPSAFVDL